MLEESGSPFEGLLLTEDKGAHRGSFIWGTWVTWRVDWPTDCPPHWRTLDHDAWKRVTRKFSLFSNRQMGARITWPANWPMTGWLRSHMTCTLTNDRLVEESHGLHTDHLKAGWGVTWPAHWTVHAELRSHVTCTLTNDRLIEESRDLQTKQWQAGWEVTWPGHWPMTGWLSNHVMYSCANGSLSISLDKKGIRSSLS